jgi:probable rRNA maturation factor
VKITIINLQNKVPVNSKRVKKTVQKVLSSEGIKKSGEITVCFITDREIRALNRKYLGRNNPTDVMAFNLSGPQGQGKICADIAISTDTAIHNAAIFGTSPLFELYLYVIHGVLHILGYDDKTKNEQLIMRKKEKFLLKSLNL